MQRVTTEPLKLDDLIGCQVGKEVVECLQQALTRKGLSMRVSALVDFPSLVLRVYFR